MYNNRGQQTPSLPIFDALVASKDAGSKVRDLLDDYGGKVSVNVRDREGMNVVGKSIKQGLLEALRLALELGVNFLEVTKVAVGTITQVFCLQNEAAAPMALLLAELDYDVSQIETTSPSNNSPAYQTPLESFLRQYAGDNSGYYRGYGGNAKINTSETETKIVFTLLHHGACFEDILLSKFNPLLAACSQTKLEKIALAIIARGGFTFERGLKNETALMKAAGSGMFNAVQALLHEGVDGRLIRDDGATALYFAMRGNFCNIAKLIRTHVYGAKYANGFDLKNAGDEKENEGENDDGDDEANEDEDVMDEDD